MVLPSRLLRSNQSDLLHSFSNFDSLFPLFFSSTADHNPEGYTHKKGGKIDFEHFLDISCGWTYPPKNLHALVSILHSKVHTLFFGTYSGIYRNNSLFISYVCFGTYIHSLSCLLHIDSDVDHRIHKIHTRWPEHICILYIHFSERWRFSCVARFWGSLFISGDFPSRNGI